MMVERKSTEVSARRPHESDPSSARSSSSCMYHKPPTLGSVLRLRPAYLPPACVAVVACTRTNPVDGTRLTQTTHADCEASDRMARVYLSHRRAADEKYSSHWTLLCSHALTDNLRTRRHPQRALRCEPLSSQYFGNLALDSPHPPPATSALPRGP